MLKSLLIKNGLFNALSDSFIDCIEAKLTRLSFKIGHTVLQSGQPGDGLYIIYSGKVRVVDDTKSGKPITLATLTEGDNFGERSLLYKEPVASTVRAAGNLVLLKLSVDDFASLIEEFPEFRGHIEDHIHRYSEYNFLKTLNVLADLTPKETQALIESMDTVHLKKDEFLFHEKDPGDAAFIVRDGRIRVVKESRGDTLLAVMRPGDLFGEISLLHSEPRSAGAIAIGGATILRLHQDAFQKILSESKSTSDILSKQVSNRLLQHKASTTAQEETDLNQTGVRIPDLQVRTVAVGEGRIPKSYPFVAVDTPILSGIACLAVINHFYHLEINLQQLIERQVLENQPDTLTTLNRKLEDQGYITRQLKLDEKTLSSPAFPAIVESADGSLSVVYSVSKEYVVCADPLKGVVEIPREEFTKTWDHKLLTVTYVPDFGSAGKVDVSLLKRFLPMARPYWKLIAGIFLVSLVIQLFGLVAPIFSKIIIDKVLVHGDYSLLFLMLLGMLFVSLFQLLSGTLREFLIAHALRRISVSLLLRFFKHILYLPSKLFSRFDVGGYTQRFQENENFLQLISQSGFKIIVDTSTIFIYLLVLLQMNAKLTGVSMIFVALYAITIIVSTPMLRANDRKVFKHRSETQTFLIENVMGIDTVKSLAAENQFFKEGLSKIIGTKRAEFEGGLLSFNIGLLSNLFNQANVIFILGYGAMLTLQGKLTTGELVAFNAMIGLLFTPLMGLIGMWDELQQIHISFERINDVLMLPPEKIENATDMPPIEGHVSFKNVSFCYGENEDPVLNDISLEAKPGQKIAIVGRSGSGKTSLINLLIKLYEPSGGHIFVDHRDIAAIEPSTLRRQIGVVEQQPFLFNGTIRENIAKADPEADLEKVVAAAVSSGAHVFIKELPMGYDTQIGERGLKLSGGQRQRLVIARAVLKNPNVLILDEATAALDSESEQIIQRNIDELMASRTTFVIAHRLSTVRNADLIMVLDQGRIAETGTHEELMEKEEFIII